jgi:hypothetical protein
MTWSQRRRQLHRWLSIVFTLTVIANFVALGMGGGAQPPAYITYAPLPPLFLLMFSGLYNVRAAVHRAQARRLIGCHPPRRISLTGARDASQRSAAALSHSIMAALACSNL